MSRDPDDVNKLTESTYKNVMEQFNPGLRNLVNLGKSYEKSVTAMNLAGRAYFDAVSKIGENAAVSPVSRELGVVLMEIAEVHKQVQLQLEESLKRFHKEIIVELEKKTEMDVKYMTATFKRYQSEHKMRQDSIDRSHADLKKLRRKSQGKHSSKYDIKETEYLESISSGQTEMQKFIADGCTEALLEEKRRFCFLVDKHCTFSYQMAAFHVKAKDILSVKLQSWQEKCCDASRVPDSILSMIESMNTPVSITPEPSPIIDRFDRNSDSVAPPPKPNASHLVNMFASDHSSRPVSTEHYLDQDSYDGGSMSRSTSVSSGINIMKKPQVKTVFRHTSGNNQTLLSFNEDEIITLLIQEEKDGWLYGELETTGQRGWFPSSYCEPYSGAAITNMTETPRHSLDLEDFSKQSREDEEEEEQLVHLPPPDYSDSSRKPSTSSPAKMVSNGTSTPPFLGGGNPFATVRLRPTITNDRSAPVI